MSKKELDFDKEVEKLARKSNLNMRKSEYAFEKQLKKLDAFFNFDQPLLNHAPIILEE